jgi:hypothetical protein
VHVGPQRLLGAVVDVVEHLSQLRDDPLSPVLGELDAVRVGHERARKPL